LWPFVLIAVAIVAVFGALAFARKGGPPNLQVSSRVSGTPTPTAERHRTESGARESEAFSASGAWTMSSLPACFFEQDHLLGGLAQLRPRFPSVADRVPPGTTIRWGDCTIAVHARELRIARGTDRLRVPPDARLYRRGERLTLVWTDGRRAEIRHYCRGFNTVRCATQSFPRPSAKRV